MERFLNLVERVQRGNRKVTAVIESVGVLALLLIMTITCADVIGAKAFLKPVPGALDIVMLAQTVAMSFCVAATLIVGGHVSVDIVLMHTPPLLKKYIVAVMELLSLLLFVLIVWQLAVYGHEMWEYQEVSPTARIPLYPFAFGIALATLPVCIELCTRVIKTVLGKGAGA